MRRLVLLAALSSGCVPGGLLRVEQVDAVGQARIVELPRGASEADVRAALGPPRVVRQGAGGVVFWLYAFARSGRDYVLEFRGGRLRWIHERDRHLGS